MKKIFIFLLFLFNSSSVYSQNPGDSIFSGIQIHTINFIFPQPDYWDSLTIYYNNGLEQYIPATVIVNGIAYDSVGVRFKGNSSYTHPYNKKPFRLSFDEFKSAQRIDGLKSLHLNNCWRDPSFMREKIYLDFCREAGIHTPRGNYARVSINDTLWGFYSLVEHVDKKFLFSHYGDDTGDLFKAVDAYDVSTLVSDFRWYGAIDTVYRTRYELKTEESITAWPNLISLIDTINNNRNLPVSYPTKINTPALFKALAADILFANLDAYINSGRNFYFYFHPVTGKMEWIIWDTGLSFGAYTGGIVYPETLSVTYLYNATKRPLLGKLYNTPVLKNRYLRTLACVYNDYFVPSSLFNTIDSVANVIRPFVYEDPRKMYSSSQFETNIHSDVNAGVRFPGLKSFITARSASVQTQLANLGVTCSQVISPGDVVINEFMADNDSITDPSGETEDWIEIYNNTFDTLDLTGLFLSNDPSHPVKWRFPANTIINPDDYLIVWADEDSTQEGIHANFELNSTGGYLRLSNTDSLLMDSMYYGHQAVNRTRARVPNGTGKFFTCYPTFDTTNTNQSLFINPAIETVILPRFIEGLNGTNSNRLPFAYRVLISGLLPEATYRYINQVVTFSDAVTTNGAGNCIFSSTIGSFIRTSGPSLATAGNHGTFVTDETGSYEGWFITEPTGNARFVPGKFVFMRIILNDGAAGTSAATRLTTTDSVRVLRLLNVSGDSTGTGLRCTSGANPMDFVFVYDDTSGTDRPIAGSFIENDGTDNSTATNYAAFYSNSVNAVNGAFGIVIPNQLTNGIRRIERRSREDGQLTAFATDDDGIWPNSANTVNPSGGTTEIVLTGSDVNQLIDITSDFVLPTQTALLGNFPNPFNPATTIRYYLSRNGKVSLNIYNILGQEVRTLLNRHQTAGEYSIQWDGKNNAGQPVSSGIYIYRIQSGEFIKSHKMMLIK